MSGALSKPNRIDESHDKAFIKVWYDNDSSSNIVLFTQSKIYAK